MEHKAIAVLREAFPGLVFDALVDERNIMRLFGECESWQQVVEVGHLAAKQPDIKNVVNKMTARDTVVPVKDYSRYIHLGLQKGITAQVDVLIIGAGVSGCGIARELSKYPLDILVVDMGEDVATAATKANNGNIHPGHAVKPGTLKAKLNVQGNRMYTQWAEELGFELQRCGAMGVITDERLMEPMKQALAVAQMNGVDGVELIGPQRALELEPGLAAKGIQPVAALWLPSMGLVEPYKVTVALAENAAENGVRFWFDCTVGDILAENGKVTGAVTSKGIVQARYVINCAGVYADEISAMAGDECYTIHPRKGTIAILDKNRVPEYASLTEVIDGSKPKKANAESKGGGMCRTPDWNILMGPSATEVPDKEDVTTTPEDLAYAMGRRQDEGIGYGDIIRFFAGSRPAEYTEDFVIEMSPVTDGFINVGGIQSPGLAAAPAIAAMVEDILKNHAQQQGQRLEQKPDYNPVRTREVEFRHLSREQQDALIEKDPRYGHIICRCESITEGEIVHAIHSPVVPVSVDAIKRRTRAGMGRCQGGFCQPRVLEILARELGRDWIDINLRDAGTNILVKGNRPDAGEQGAAQ